MFDDDKLAHLSKVNIFSYKKTGIYVKMSEKTNFKFYISFFLPLLLFRSENSK